jgi:hypothetical protein
MAEFSRTEPHHKTFSATAKLQQRAIENAQMHCDAVDEEITELGFLLEKDIKEIIILLLSNLETKILAEKRQGESVN